jgi:beta-galactosidase/beta-glucuronidase
MELSFWTEVAWLKMGEQELAAGSHTLEIRLPKTLKESGNEKGKPNRILYASDALVIYRGAFHPCSKFKPDRVEISAKDQAAAQQVFRFSEATSPESRVSLKLDGLWEVTRHDEQMPGEVAAPIQDFPVEPRWSAIPVPSNKNESRPDLIFAHRLWYRTRVLVPEALAGRSFFLVFPQNNLNTTVYVNGQFCGFDKNPFARVQIDVTRGLRTGTNELWVGIKDAWYGFSTSPADPLKLRKRFNLPVKFFADGFQDLAYPIWNHPQSGILVTPELVAAGTVYISDVFVKPSVAQKQLSLDLAIKNPTERKIVAQVACEVVDPASGQTVMAFDQHALPTEPRQEMTLNWTKRWENPRLWWPD